ncbi:MAG TPA: helix-turn-helix transcriptional regulator [Xanthobacteraceae bacterium]
MNEKSKPSMKKTIAASRADFGFSLQDLAERAGITKSHLWDLEQGRSVNPTVKTIHGLAEALGHTFAYMAQGAINDALE